MGSVVAPVLLALLTALVVLAVSAVASAGRPPRALLADARDAVRGGLRRERWSRAVAAAPGERGATPTAGADGGARGSRAELPDDEEETSVEDLFTIGQAQAEDYVRADRLAAVLERAGGVVVGGVQQVQHRVRR